MQINVPLPLQMLQKATNQLGHQFWVELETYAKEQKNQWNTKCYIPSDKIKQFLIEYCSKYEITLSLPTGATVALANWRRCKEIYLFSDELLESLIENSSMALSLSITALDTLPYDCFYLDCRIDPYCGFYVYFDYDCVKQIRILRIEGVDQSRHFVTTKLSYYYSGETIADGIKAALVARRNTVEEIDATYDNAYAMQDNYIQSVTKTVVPKVIQLLLYLCSENAQITLKDTPMQSNELLSSQKDLVASETREWQVGNNNEIVLKAGSRSLSSGTISHTTYEAASTRTRSPHIRKAHWHHYWVGKRGTAERRLVIKWIPPTVIASEGSSNGNSITTINKLDRH